MIILSEFLIEWSQKGENDIWPLPFSSLYNISLGNPRNGGEIECKGIRQTLICAGDPGIIN
jgi:hypothetical protein